MESYVVSYVFKESVYAISPVSAYIDLKPETKIDLRAAAKASIAWAEMVERTGAHFDPLNLTKIELEASVEGSQIIKAMISSVTEDPKGIPKIAIVTSLLFIAKTTFGWTWEQVLEYIQGEPPRFHRRLFSSSYATLSTAFMFA